jgi:hypothetical protein
MVTGSANGVKDGRSAPRVLPLQQQRGVPRISVAEKGSLRRIGRQLHWFEDRGIVVLRLVDAS